MLADRHKQPVNLVSGIGILTIDLSSCPLTGAQTFQTTLPNARLNPGMEVCKRPCGQ